jgi:hypothetical protein
MRRSWTPSIVPNIGDQTIYLVADRLGRLGDVWREADCGPPTSKRSSRTF